MSRKPAPSSPLPDSARARSYRDRMRAAGLRQVQVWVPDTKAPSFARKLRRQIALLQGKPEEHEALDLIEALQDTAD